MSLCNDKAFPVVAPPPFIILTTPSGKPASLNICPNLVEANGANSGGFKTTQFPAANAGA